MNNSSKSISLIIAAGLAGVASFKLANSAFTAALPGEALVAIAVAGALIALAVSDYSRRIQPLRLPGRLLRPTLATCTAARTPASGTKSTSIDRLAA